MKARSRKTKSERAEQLEDRVYMLEERLRLVRTVANDTLVALRKHSDSLRNGEPRDWIPVFESIAGHATLP